MKNKPTIKDVIDGFSRHYNDTSNEGEEDIVTRNNRFLSGNKYEDYNIENFRNLIQAIEFDGLSHFNMTTFIASIKNFSTVDEYGNDYDIPVNELKLNFSAITSGNAFDNTTKSFNCDSVGCIAGFATAKALDWKQPEWMKLDSREYLNFFEHMACNYLNIPLEVGRRLFYGENGSVWSFVRFFEPENYGSIRWENVDKGLNHHNYDYDDQWEGEEIDLSTIDYKAAVDVLNRIASGEIRFDDENDYLPYYSKGKE